MTVAIIVDVDGTLADVSSIRHYVADNAGKRDFGKFHAAASFVPANQWVVDRVNEIAQSGGTIIVVTSRHEKWRYRTQIWLNKWDITFDLLLMRPDHDYRPDVDVKRDILREIRKRGFEVRLAIDDNPSILTLWEEEQIPTLIVPGWPESPPFTPFLSTEPKPRANE